MSDVNVNPLYGDLKAHAAAQPALVLPTDHPALQGNGLSSPSVTLCQYAPIAIPVIQGVAHFMPGWVQMFIIQPLIGILEKACPAGGS